MVELDPESSVHKEQFGGAENTQKKNPVEENPLVGNTEPEEKAESSPDESDEQSKEITSGNKKISASKKSGKKGCLQRYFRRG